jgi:hypothetical protein
MGLRPLYGRGEAASNGGFWRKRDFFPVKVLTKQRIRPIITSEI